MRLWHDALLTAIYTLSPTHCGTGQTTGAVDLPIARDAATGLPILPPTSLKGVARDYAARSGKLKQWTIEKLFGPKLKSNEDANLSAGMLSFTEGQLIAYPARALARPYLHVTSPALLERLRRLLAAVELDDFFPQSWAQPRPEDSQAFVADPELNGQTLVVEDVVFESHEVGHFQPLTDLGQQLAGLIPSDLIEDAETWAKGLVLLPDRELVDLVDRAIPVQARIQLNDNKTSNNLWYEENLPSDCLFMSLVGEQRHPATGNSDTKADESKPNGQNLDDLRRVWPEALSVVQIGGNETVGQGVCAWGCWQGGGGQ